MKTLQTLMEMAKRSTPEQFYKLAKEKYGAQKVRALKWPEIAAISKEHQVLIPPYLRSQKVGRGLFNLVPPGHADEKLNNPVEKKVEKAEKPDPADNKVISHKEEPKVEAPKEYKMPHTGNITYTEWPEMYRDLKKKFGEVELKYVPHGQQRHGRHGAKLGIELIVNKKNDEVLGYWETTSADMIPGRGFTTYGYGGIAQTKPKEEPKPEPRARRKGGEATERQMRDALQAVINAMKNAVRSASGYGGQTWRPIEPQGKGFEFDVRDWGGWEGDDGSGDYDFQNLTRKSSKDLEQIITRVEKEYPTVKLDWQTGEKNWIYVSAQ